MSTLHTSDGLALGAIMLALVGTVMLRSASEKVLLRAGDGVLGTHPLRDRLIGTPMRAAHHQDLHLPHGWRWEPGLDELFGRALHDPLPGAS